jgi:hypothetical protein
MTLPINNLSNALLPPNITALFGFFIHLFAASSDESNILSAL